MSRLTRFLSGILTLLFIAMVSVGGVVAWFAHAVDAKGPLKEQITVTVRPGDGSRIVARRLEEQGIISSQLVFLAQIMSQNHLARLGGKRQKQLRAGEYVVAKEASVREVIRTLTEGRAVLYSVTVPEGLTSYAVVQRLRADTNLSGEIAEAVEEGTLLPETFRVPRDMPRAEVLSLLRGEQRKFLESEWAIRQPDLPIKSIKEAVILASIVEKESGPRDDPARIAGVFINRLRKGVRLQSDPTILYGKHGPQVKWGSTIYRSDIRRKTDYNTYQIDGLPPGPICNPGRRAIRAVLNPANTKDMFFVADGRGGHVFSQTLRQHEAAVRKWRKIEREIRANEAKQNSADARVASAVASAGGSSNSNDLSATDRAVGPVPLPVRRPKRP